MAKIAGWKKVYESNRRMQWQNKKFDVLTLETLEVGLYQPKPKYRLEYNKYTLGIFKVKKTAIDHAIKFMKKHQDRRI